MRWLKFFGIACVILCLFAGGITFDVFVIQKFTQDKGINFAQNEEKNIKISQMIQTTQKVKPTLLQITLNINASHKLYNNTPTLSEKEHADITQNLNNIVKLVQENANICKQKPYSFEPRTEVRNEAQNYGYRVRMEIECTMKEQDFKAYEKFAVQLKKILYKDGWLELGISSFDFSIADSEKLAQEKILRELTIQEANGLTQEYNKNLHTTCHIESLHFGQGVLPYKMAHRSPVLQNSMEDSANSGFSLDMQINEAAPLSMSLNTQANFACDLK